MKEKKLEAPGPDSSVTPPAWKQIAFRISLAYVGVGALWIALSDRAAHSLFDDSSLDSVQTIKGWIYVIATGLLLYLLISRHEKRMRKTQEALAVAEEKFRRIFENSTAGIFRATPDGRFLAANPALAEILGYGSPDELMGESGDAASKDADRVLFEEMGRIIKENGSLRRAEIQMYRKDGARIWISYDARAVRDPEGAIIYFEGSVQDITERKMLEDQFRQAQKMEAIGRLAGGIAHDFNNLLTAIIGYSQLVQRRLEATDPLSRHLEEIEKAAVRASNLTGQLLAFSRRQVVQPREVDLNSVINDISGLLRRLIGEDIELVVDLDESPGLVMADVGQMDQVIMNLAVNARDAMPSGGVLTLKTSDCLSPERSSDRGHPPVPSVLLEVSDTGCGIDAETIQHVFDPFFTTKERGKGTGLGLSTVYGIVKQSGGEVTVESEPGKGTSFRIYLPRIRDNERKPVQETAQSALPAGTETILLVEDEAAVRILARDVLSMSGYNVLVAESGGDALRVAEEYDGPVHMLVTDIVMPQMSGKELARRIMPFRTGIRVLFLSGYPETLAGEDAGAGMEFLQKPFTPIALSRKVRGILDESGKVEASSAS